VRATCGSKLRSRSRWMAQPASGIEAVPIPTMRKMRRVRLRGRCEPHAQSVGPEGHQMPIGRYQPHERALNLKAAKNSRPSSGVVKGGNDAIGIHRPASAVALDQLDP